MAQDEIITLLGFKLSAGSLHNVSAYTRMVNDAQKAILRFGAAVSAIQLTRYFASQANSLQKNSEILNENTETLQRWGYYATKAGVSADSLYEDMKKLNEKSDPAFVWKFNLGLAALGINTRKTSGELKTITELFNELAPKLKKMAPSIAMNMGKELGLSNETIKFLRELKDTGEAESAIIPKEVIERLAKYHRELNTLALHTKKYGTIALDAFATPLSKAVEKFKEWTNENDKVISAHAIHLAQQLAVAIEDIAKALSLVVDVTGKIAKGIGLDKLFDPDDEHNVLGHLLAGLIGIGFGKKIFDKFRGKGKGAGVGGAGGLGQGGSAGSKTTVVEKTRGEDAKLKISKKTTTTVEPLPQTPTTPKQTTKTANRFSFITNPLNSIKTSLKSISSKLLPFLTRITPALIGKGSLAGLALTGTALLGEGVHALVKSISPETAEKIEEFDPEEAEESWEQWLEDRKLKPEGFETFDHYLEELTKGKMDYPLRPVQNTNNVANNTSNFHNEFTFNVNGVLSETDAQEIMDNITAAISLQQRT